MRSCGRHSTKLYATSSSASANTWKWKSDFSFRLRPTPCEPKIGQESTQAGAIGRIRCSTWLLKKNVSPCESEFCIGGGAKTRASRLDNAERRFAGTNATLG